MTKISQYSLDNNIGGNDKWIGSDAQNFLMTKNFTPNNVATYFNNNNVIDIGTSIRYRYQTLDVGDSREQGTISFETEVGPQVNFSSITTFLLAKNTLKQNDVTQYLSLLVGAYVLISKASNINTFGFYKISSIEPYIPDPNFFVVVVEFQSGNGFIYEDLDYLISLVDKNTGGSGGTQDLQQTLLNGNTATDIGIQFINTGGGSSIIYYNRIVNNGIDYYWPSGDSSVIATESYVDDNAYPLNSNPAGYLTQEEVEEYPDLASFPATGTIGVIYIALDTGLFYTWNGSAYVVSSPPDTGITGGGIINRIPRFTPNGVTIGNSNFSDTGAEGRYSISSTNFVSFYPGANIWLRLQRATTNRIDFELGNPGISQPNEINSSNALGFEISSKSTSGYVSLKAGTAGNEGLRVLSSGKIQFAQTPDAGTTSDFILLRDSSGNIKQIAYPTIPSVSGYVPYTGATQNVDLGEFELKAGQLTLDVSPTGTAAVGTTRWNNTIGSSETTLKGGSVILKNGVDLVARVVNKVTPNTTLTKAAYQAVRVSGAQGQRLAVAYAQANNDNNSADTIGLVCETIPTNQEGFILTVGQLEGINTTGSLQGETWNDGDVVYLSPTVAGSLTNVKPTAPGHIVVIGYVEYAHAVHGKLYVKIMNGWELDELHNVNITSPTNGQALVYNSILGLWENNNLNADKIADGSVSNAEFQRLDGVTSNIQNQINSKQDKTTVFKNTTQTVVTGTTSETIIYAEEVLANSISNNTILSFKSRFGRNPRVGTCALKLYLNTVNNLSGSPVAIAQVTINANTGVQPFIREQIFIKDNVLSLLGSSNALSDVTTTGGVLTTSTYNINTTYYWILTAQPNTSTDSLTHNFSILGKN
jgi:hypothetical protein